MKRNAPIPRLGSPSSEVSSDEVLDVDLRVDLASPTTFSMKSSEIRRDGCSLKTEFINAILAALRRASAFVGQFWEVVKDKY